MSLTPASCLCVILFPINLISVLLFTVLMFSVLLLPILLCPVLSLSSLTSFLSPSPLLPIPHLSSLIPHPFSLISHLSSSPLLPHTSSLLPHPFSLPPPPIPLTLTPSSLAPHGLIPHTLSLLPIPHLSSFIPHPFSLISHPSSYFLCMIILITFCQSPLSFNHMWPTNEERRNNADFANLRNNAQLHIPFLRLATFTKFPLDTGVNSLMKKSKLLPASRHI